jgi:hypothetical protein
MRGLFIFLTVIEITVFLGALVVYLLRIISKLNEIVGYLGRISFGVRAIESQTEPIGPGVLGINERLATIAAAVDDLASQVERTG